MLPFPSFYDPTKVPELYVERAGLVADAARGYAAEHGITKAATDTTRIAAFGIDCQVGFCVPGASLFVPGAVEDTRRAVEWIYRNLGAIHTLAFSLDTHSVFQVFHPAWWRGRDGAPPPPFSVITSDDVKNGTWRPVAHERETLEYTEKLAAQGKYVLTVWPYHALQGGLSHALVPALMEAAIFHAIAREQPTRFEAKGEHPLTENYSVLSPEVTELGGAAVGALNTRLFESLLSHDRVYVFGQAKSHCVLSTLLDLKSEIEKRDPSQLSKIHVLVDATSPVPPPPLDPLPAALDFPAVAERAFQELARAGMRLVTTADVVSV